MDGTRSRTTISLARWAAAITAAAAALCCSAPALAADPAVEFAPGSPAATAAVELADSYWNTTPCGGTVSIVWTALSTSTNATSTWSNSVSEYDAPERNVDCQIVFNSALVWDWTRFCSILVHEYGHLDGRPHTDDADDVMYPYYERPVAQCVAAAPARRVVVSEPVPSAATPATPAETKASSSSRKVKRAVIVVVREPKRRAARHRHRHR
jgi:hypothetical protein